MELNGVLVSWAVPKGPSLKAGERHLAAKVEDHPLDYGGFEGIIPQGQYGGGEVIVWDRGFYESQKSPGDRATQEAELTKELEVGKIEFVLYGEKLKGAWVLVHTRENQWLLMKRKDEFASDEDVLAQDKSVISGHRIGGVPDAEHPSKPKPETVKPKPEENLTKTKTEKGGAKSKYAPMLLTEVDKPFVSDDWLFELKLDGVRVIVDVEDGKVDFATRNDKEVCQRFPEIVDSLAALNVKSAVLDGEIVHFDQDGLPDFQALIQPFQAGMVHGADFCIFDVLALNGAELIHKPLSERKAILDKIDFDQPHLRRLDTFAAEGKALFENATKLGFEGVVGKRLDSEYQPGIRSRDWVKIKGYHSEEFLVAGYTKGENARSSTFGALVLAQQTDSGLVHVGNVGGGFGDDDLDQVSKLLAAKKIKTSPFKPAPKIPGVTWVEPGLVVEVRFMKRTKDGKLRFPIFLRLRPDVQVATVKEQPKEKEQPKMDPVQSVLDQLAEAGDDTHVEVNGHKIHFSHLGKELWPEVTKCDLARYYATVSESLLLYLKDRPISFVRTPDGAGGERFFQKHWEKGRPEFVKTVSVYSDSNHGARDFILVDNLETLVWLSQIAVVELNPWDSRIVDEHGKTEDFAKDEETLDASILNRPDYLVLDLDPYFGGKATGWQKDKWLRLVEVAYTLKDILEGVGLKSFAKSSGKSGLHVYVPVAQDYTYDQIRAAAGTIGAQAIELLGNKVTLEWNIKKRPDGVFIDVNQNVRGKTMAAPYSPRAAAFSGVSMPLKWEELDRVDPTEFTILTAPKRLSEKGDLWSATLGIPQKLFT